MLRLLPLALLVSCYHPSYQDCAIACTATSGCPSGYTCDVGMSLCASHGSCSGGDGGGGDALDPGGDADGDQIPNGQDNCPLVANHTQRDKDGDGIGDVCDPCPVSTDNTDTDGDGVADFCDPHPVKVGGNVITDHIVGFDGFQDAFSLGETPIGPDGAALDTAMGTVTIDASGGHLDVLAFPILASTGGETIMTSFAYTGTLGTLVGGGPITNLTPGTSDGIGCELVVDSTNASEIDIYDTSNSSYDGSALTPDDPANPPNVHTLALSRTPTMIGKATFSCRDGSSSKAATLSTPTKFDGGLFMHDAVAIFHYVLVVRTGT